MVGAAVSKGEDWVGGEGMTHEACRRFALDIYKITYF